MTGSYLVLVALLGCVLAASDSTEGQQESAQAKLDKLCEQKSVQLGDHKNVLAIIQLVKEGQIPISCPEGVKQALLDLDDAINEESVCEPKSIDQMERFWYKYFGKSADVKKNQLPKPIGDFFIIYGFLVSERCKYHLIGYLKEMANKNFVPKEDINLIKELVKGKYLDLLVNKMDPEDLIVVADFETITGEAYEKGQKKLQLTPERAYIFEYVQDRCRNRIKPLYDYFFTPIIRLMLMGFKYNSNFVEIQMENRKKMPFYKDWFNMALNCEPIIRYQVEVKPRQDGTNQLSDEQKATLRELAGLGELQADNGEKDIVYDHKVKFLWDDFAIKHERVFLINSKLYRRNYDESDRLRMYFASKLLTLAQVWLDTKNLRFGLQELADERGQQIDAWLEKYTL